MPVPKDAEQPDPVNGMFKGIFSNRFIPDLVPKKSENFEFWKTFVTIFSARKTGPKTKF